MRWIIPAVALAGCAATIGTPSRPAQAAVVSSNAVQITLTLTLTRLPPEIIPGNPA